MQTVGAFALILDSQKRILLCHRTDRDMWNLPGGGVEKQETPWHAVVREVEEETGLLVQVDNLMGVYVVPEKASVVFCFSCQVIGGSMHTTPEADQIDWFDHGHIPANTLPRHIERINDAFTLAGSVCLRIQTLSVSERSAS